MTVHAISSLRASVAPSVLCKSQHLPPRAAGKKLRMESLEEGQAQSRCWMPTVTHCGDLFLLQL